MSAAGRTIPAGWIRDALRDGFRQLETGKVDAAAAVCRRYENEAEPMRRVLDALGVPLEHGEHRS